MIRMSNSVLFGLRERSDWLQGAVGRIDFLEAYRLVGLDLPDEVGHRSLDEVKVLLAGVSEPDLEVCATRAREHYTALCAGVEE